MDGVTGAGAEITFRDSRATAIQVVAKFLRLKEDMVTRIYDRFRPGLTPDDLVREGETTMIGACLPLSAKTPLRDSTTALPLG